MDCGTDTGARGLGEYPLMLRDEVWRSIVLPPHEGVLCRADMERRLGRPLTSADLRDRGAAHDIAQPGCGEMVERIALKLAEGDQHAHMPEYRRRAREIIVAMRKPTEMQERVMERALGSHRPPTRRWHWVWQEMIDTELLPPGSELLPPPSDTTR